MTVIILHLYQKFETEIGLPAICTLNLILISSLQSAFAAGPGCGSSVARAPQIQTLYGMSGFDGGEGFGGDGMGGGFRGRGRGGFRGRGRGRGGRGGGPPEGPIDELKLYVGNLDWGVDDEILETSFKTYGGLVEVRPSPLA